MSNIKQFPNKGVNPAMNQFQIGEMKKMLNSAISMFVNKSRKLEERLFVLEHTIKDAFMRSEAMVDIITNKKLITVEELSEGLIKIKGQMDEAEDTIQNQLHGLEVVDRPSEVGDIVKVRHSVFDESNNLIEENIVTEMLVGSSEYTLAQMITISKELVGKKAGDTGSIEIKIAAEEKDNHFAGKTITFKYEVLKVKVVKDGKPSIKEIK